jgi:DNA modification methylase
MGARDRKPEIETALGRAVRAESAGYMREYVAPESVDLIVTSPPFALLTKKEYGNVAAGEYLAWFRPFAEQFARILKSPGSLVIEIGGAWQKGLPVRSLYQFELLLMLCREYGFYLCQEHYWYNPARLPTPAEWVCIRRLRVKDAVSTIWWLSKTPYPKASNERVPWPYSAGMEQLIAAKGSHRKGRKYSSGHDTTGFDNYETRNEGAIPPNLLAIANTESVSPYHEYCKRARLKIHPARFPARLPEYFIRMLTDPGDLVLDPFAGSCVTGRVAETLERRWLCLEQEGEYLHGARGRFQATPAPTPAASYTIHAPCPLPGSAKKLRADGGRSQSKRKGDRA